jgi:hypothetical protein
MDNSEIQSYKKLPGFCETGYVLSSSINISRSPTFNISLYEQNAFGMGINIKAEAEVLNLRRSSSLFGHPETTNEFINYLFGLNRYSNIIDFVKQLKSSLEIDENLRIFRIPSSVVSNWKENYSVDMLESLFKVNLSFIIPGPESFELSFFSTFKEFKNQYQEIFPYLDSEIKIKKTTLNDKKFAEILENNINQEEKSLKLFKNFMLKEKYEIGTSLKYISLKEKENLLYGSEIKIITGTSSALKLIGFFSIFELLNDYIKLEINGKAGIAICQSFIDNFTSQIPGLKYGPIELYRFTFLGGRKMIDFSTNLFFDIFSSDAFILTLKSGILITSIWDSGITKNQLSDNFK